jgi:ankyrin repeat protein
MFNEQEVNSSVFYSAIQTKDINTIKVILKNNYENLRYKNILGETFVHIAVKYSFNELIKLLIYEGLDIDSVDFSNRTALHLAVAIKNDNMVKYLLECKANTSIKNCYGESPFHMAIQLGRIKLVELFLQHGAKVLDVTLNTYETGFHIALKNENDEMFKLLLKNHFGNINVLDIYGETLLHKLARQKYVNTTKILLQKGADLEMVNKNNETALHFAIHRRNFNISKLFIEFGANVNAKNKYGESPLHLAIRYKDLKHVKLLLMNNADVNEHTNEYSNMLHTAICYYNKDIVSLLLQYNVNMEVRNSNNFTPFHLAIKDKNLEVAKILLNKGININSEVFGTSIATYQNENNKNQNFTSLHIAIIQKDVDTVKFLLENGAKFNVINNYDIFLAIEKGCAEIVEELIKYGANVNVKNSIGQSLLYTAMKIRYKEGVEILLKYGANLNNINETGNYKETALHLAVKAHDDKFVQFLLDIGIDVNICDVNNFTALYFAHEGTNIAKLLIENIALLKVSNLFINQRNEIIIETVQEFKLYFFKCLKELLMIKKENCYNISLINFLTKDVFTLAKYVRRKLVIINFEKNINKNKFPIYYRKLIQNMEKGLERWNLIKQVKGILCLSTFFGSLYDILDKIIDNFSNEELKNFIKISINVENNINCSR